jgi:DNA-binding PadR family transcriptional regulator
MRGRLWTLAKIGKIERKILEIIFRDELERGSLQRDEEESEIIYYLRKAATYEGALLSELKKEFEEWARRATALHPTPATIFEKYSHYMQSAREAIERLVRKGLIMREYISVEGVTLVGYNLTDKGRETLRKTAAHKKTQSDAETIQKALQALGREGLYRLRMEDIRSKIIEMDGSSEYWTGKRIGSILKTLGVRQVKKRVNGRLLRLYENPAYTPPNRLEKGLQAIELKESVN